MTADPNDADALTQEFLRMASQAERQDKLHIFSQNLALLLRPLAAVVKDGTTVTFGSNKRQQGLCACALTGP